MPASVLKMKQTYCPGITVSGTTNETLFPDIWGSKGAFTVAPAKGSGGSAAGGGDANLML